MTKERRQELSNEMTAAVMAARAVRTSFSDREEHSLLCAQFRALSDEDVESYFEGRYVYVRTASYILGMPSYASRRALEEIGIRVERVKGELVCRKADVLAARGQTANLRKVAQVIGS